VVTLRVDVEAARARTEFASASRAVQGFRGSLADAEREADRLGDELRVADARLAQSVREFEAAERAADAAADEVRRLTADVAAAGANPPRALTQELRRAEDALRAAEREETRLRDRMEETNEAARRTRRSFDDAGDEVARITRELVAANVEAARLSRQLEAAQRRANNPGRSAQRGLLGFRQQISQLLGGQQNGARQGLGDMLRDAWAAMPVEVRGAIVIAGVTMAAIFAEAVGAAVAGLLVTALGVGLAGAIAALAASTSNVVQQAFKNVFKPIGDEAVRLAQIAEGPLVHAALEFGDVWTDVGGDVREIFQTISPEIANLADGLGGFIRNVMPGLKAAAQAAVPLLQELARSLPFLGETVSIFFTELSRGGDGLVKGLRLVVQVIGGAIIVLGQLFGFLARQFDRVTNGLEIILGVLTRIPVLGRAFDGALEFMQNFNNISDGTARSLDNTGASADATALAMGRQTQATSAAARAAHDLSTKMAEIIEGELGAKDAAIQFEAALDAVTESAKENGRSLDISTGKGRANASTILDGVRAAEAKRQADIDLAGGENASAAAVAQANAKYAQQVEQIRAAAYAAGFDKAQVDALIGSLGRIPANVRTVVTTEYRTSGNIPQDQRVGSGNIKGYAAGGTVVPGLAMVGEHGPELITFRGGERVLNAVETARLTGTRAAGSDRASALAAKASAASPPVYNVYVTAPVGSTPADVGGAVVESIKAYEKTSGKGWRTN